MPTLSLRLTHPQYPGSAPGASLKPDTFLVTRKSGA